MMKNWAYGALTLNSNDNGVGTIYYTKAYFEGENLVDPTTAAPYTKEALEAIKAGNGKGEYIDAKDGALLGMSAKGTENIFWYSADDCAKIITHADPLKLNADNGELVSAGGEVIAKAL